MSIEMQSSGGGTGPVFMCDICHQRIAGDPEGIVRWNPGRLQDGVQHVHKGPCDRRSDPNRECFWENLDVWLIYLRDNLGLTKAEWRRAEECARWNEAG